MKKLALILIITASPSLAQQGPMELDVAEIYCTDAARPGFQSMGVTYNRTIPNRFGGQLQFCRVDMRALEGPSGNAQAGWRHDVASGQTEVWCVAKAVNGTSATIRARFTLLGHALASGMGCPPARAGHMP